MFNVGVIGVNPIARKTFILHIVLARKILLDNIEIIAKIVYVTVDVTWYAEAVDVNWT